MCQQAEPLRGPDDTCAEKKDSEESTRDHNSQALAGQAGTSQHGHV